MDTKDIVTIFSLVLGLVVSTLLLISVPAWFSSCRSADIFNRQNGTEYSCSDFFWAQDQINAQTQTVRLTD